MSQTKQDEHKNQETTLSLYIVTGQDPLDIEYEDEIFDIQQKREMLKKFGSLYFTLINKLRLPIDWALSHCLNNLDEDKNVHEAIKILQLSKISKLRYEDGKKDMIKKLLPWAIFFGLLSAFFLAFFVGIIAFPHAIGVAACSSLGATIFSFFASAIIGCFFYLASWPMISTHMEYAKFTSMFDAFQTEESRSKSETEKLYANSI